MINNFELREDMLVTEKDKKTSIKKYYSINNDVLKKVDYYIAIGKRSNGKTTQGLKLILEDHIKSGYKRCGAYIRRWGLDFKGNTARALWDGVIKLGWIEKYTKGRYNNVEYKSERWYLIHTDETGETTAKCEEPLCIAFSISGQAHYKSNAYPNVNYILFDEFMTRDGYLPDEFVEFQNLLSTIIRDRVNVKILMFANTVNKYCPYFNEMGLSGVKKQQQGTIDIYSYPSTDLKIALEYCEDNTKSGGKEHNKYFAFDNPRLKMITTGEWEIDIYPHLPCKFKPSEVSYTFYINFDGDIVECKIIDSLELGFPFIFCHYKSTKLKEKENEDRIVYQKEASPNPLIINNITKPTNKASQFIWSFFQNNKVFYQSNDIGEIVNNYILSCK